MTNIQIDSRIPQTTNTNDDRVALARGWHPETGKKLRRLGAITALGVLAATNIDVSPSAPAPSSEVIQTIADNKQSHIDTALETGEIQPVEVPSSETP